MVLPDLVAEAVSANLAAVDSATPGLVEGLHLTGSVAMDDFQRSRSRSRWVPSGAGTSDIDLVAVTGHLPDLTAVQALTVMHRQLGALRPGPAIDCLYLTWSDLDCDPAEVSGRVQSHAGTVTTEGDGHPVLWHELAQQARRCAARVATSWRSGPIGTGWSVGYAATSTGTGGGGTVRAHSCSPGRAGGSDALGTDMGCAQRRPDALHDQHRTDLLEVGGRAVRPRRVRPTVAPCDRGVPAHPQRRTRPIEIRQPADPPPRRP